MEHRFYTLDVFTNNRFEGNPLAVFTDGDELSDDQMLAIAREMNLSETVFVQKPTDEEALARLRIFTTKEELKLAGHPVIGTWFLLAELGVVPAQEGGVHILQETGAGVLPVEIRFKDGRSEEHTSELQSRLHLVCRLLLEKKKITHRIMEQPVTTDCATYPVTPRICYRANVLILLIQIAWTGLYFMSNHCIHLSIIEVQHV